MPAMFDRLRQLLRRGPRSDASLGEGAMIMAVDYQRRGSNFDFGGKRYGIDRAFLTVGDAQLPYERVRALRINRSHVGGLLGRFSPYRFVLMAVGLMPATPMASIMRAEIIATDGTVHAVSSMTACGFGKMPINQLDAFRWFLACLVNRLPKQGCEISVGSYGGFVAGIGLVLVALPLAGLGMHALREEMWLFGGSLVGMAIGCATVGANMVLNGRRRRVDAAGLLAYVGQD